MVLQQTGLVIDEKNKIALVLRIKYDYYIEYSIKQ